VWAIAPLPLRTLSLLEAQCCVVAEEVRFGDGAKTSTRGRVRSPV
jgi:hypothetical protein